MSVVSMTGFGRAEGVAGPLRWIWELRCVNGRGLDIRTRVPTGFEALEGPVREAAQKKMRRGSLQVSLNIRREERVAAGAINLPLIDQLVAASAPYVAAGKAAPPRWDGLLLARGVLGGDSEEETPEARAALERSVMAGLEPALAALSRTREQEGEKTRAALLSALAKIEELTAQARILAAAQPDAMLERIRSRLSGLAPEIQIDPQRLAQEAALVAVRADVREELDRLTAHAEEARSLIDGPESAGRRLDFLSQEFNREANTLCSKSSDLALTRIGLDLKTAIDQMREQAANVE
jgi:uncharacterized protein (TIGR00255 family)